MAEVGKARGSVLSVLLREPDIRKLWVGQSLSELGSRVSELAIPLTAIVFLHATATQMGYLTFAQRVPFILIALWVGVWLDRRRRRNLLIASDLGRAGLLLLIPIGYSLGFLELWMLYPISLAVGCLTVVGELGSQSYVPVLVPAHQLLPANSALEVSRSSAEVAGPSLAGLLIQAMSAPLAIIVNSATFLVSALATALVRHREPLPERPEVRRSTLADIRVGMGTVFRHGLLRSAAIAAAVFNFAITGMLTIYTLFLVRVLDLSPGMIGVTFSAFGAGAVAASLLAPKLLDREKLGRQLMITAALCVLGISVLPIANGDNATPVLLVGMALYGWGVQGFNLGALTVRQLVTPLSMLGRVGGALRFVSGCAAPLGALLAGLAADAFGVRETMWMCAGVTWICLLYLLLSPMARLTASGLPSMTISEDHG